MQHIEDLKTLFTTNDHINLFLRCPNMYRMLDHFIGQLNYEKKSRNLLISNQRTKIEKISENLKSYLGKLHQ